MTTFLLWADLETTGLEPRMDTVLESAWAITNDDLDLLTPLRRRLCNIQPPNRRQHAVDYPTHPLRNVTTFKVGDPQEPEAGNWDLLPQVVQEMHETSGLKDALRHATNNPVEALRLLTSASDLGRLIQEDLADVGYNRFTDTLVLAGAGVSHFDNRVLGLHLPDMFPFGGNGRVGYAYWQHDVSVAARVFGESTWDALKLVALDLPRDHAIYADLAMFDFGNLVSHRAADDVVCALLVGRILRAATGWGLK